MWQTIIGLGAVALTAAYFWWQSRRRYRCPHCGRFVQWKDVNCPHCGEDMNFRHRDPGAITRVERDYRSPRRNRRK